MKTADCYIVGKVVREVEIARNWFRSSFVVVFLFYITKMFTEAVCKGFSAFLACRFNTVLMSVNTGLHSNTARTFRNAKRKILSMVERCLR